MGFYASGYVSALGKNSSGGSTCSASALYQLADVMPNSTNDGVLNAVNGSVLMYNGSKWQAGNVVTDISTLTFNVNGSKLFDYNGKSSITANLTVPTKLSQLTDDVVSGKYLPLTGGTMNLGARISSNSSLYFGNSSNSGWLYFMDMASQAGTNYWQILQSGNASFSGTVSATTFRGSLSGNAATASKWQTARTLTLTGSVTGSASIDGSGNVSLATTTNHTHSYLPLSGGAMQGSIKFSNSSLPEKTLQYVCGVDAFVNGGEMGWMGGAAFVNQYAPTLTGTGASGTWDISITGNAATATNADMLDNVHYQNILERSYSGLKVSGTGPGWFRIARTKLSDGNGISFILFIQRVYNSVDNEAYTFSISISYAGGINITQLSGYANYRIITKIRADWKSGNIAYIDLYIPSSSTNHYSWSTVGCAESYTDWIANPTLVGTAYEFTTVNGCKSDRGFTGTLTGNALSATKLQTARTIWGQSFDGTANINGNMTGVGSITRAANGAVDTDEYGNLKFQNLSSVSSDYWRVALADSTKVLVVRNNGNVGIGDPNPVYKLEVAGNCRISSTTYIATTTSYGALTVGGNIAATGAVTAKASSSDIRLKTDITDYKALSIIRNHRSIKYHWNEAAKANADIFNNNDWHFGLIAQELQQEFPQMVSDVFRDYLVINYERLIPICWKGLQEVDDEVTRLKKKVRKLEMEIRELKQERR